MVMAGLPTVAAASAPAAGEMPVQVADNAVSTVVIAASPCGHCTDGSDVPCPPAASGCTMVCVSSPPALGAGGPALPVLQASGASWMARLASLHGGLSPPPDPFPPKS